MNCKLLLTSLGVMALLCLISPQLNAQSQPESSENVLVFQKGEKEKVGRTGDYVIFKTENHKRPYGGRMTAITDSTIVVRGREVKISALKKIVLGRRFWRRLGGWTLVAIAIAPFAFGTLLSYLAPRYSPIALGDPRAQTWIRLRRALNLIYGTMVLGGTFALANSFRRYKMKKWKVKIERRTY